ncbi:MAG TPA: DUF5657 family protein [Patescibacteria group bacterium]|nr:DUF5657 family protein [Patescibacteria group bacterium]
MESNYLFTLLHITSLFKVGTLGLILLFFIFVIVILKQVRSMNKVVTQPYLYPFLLLIGWGLIIATVVLFIVAVVIL